MGARVFGSAIRRREDPRLITGTATYTDDLMLPGMVHAAILRSPYAHARIKKIDTHRARHAPGVIAVFTGADTNALLKPMPCAWLLPNADLKVATYQPVATDVVRYVGECVAVVVAENRYQAQDALDLIDVDYDPLPAAVDPKKATAKGAPQLHADVPGNLAFHWTVAGGDVDAAFASADVTVSDRIIQQRLIPTAIETRAALASFVKATGELTLWNTTQNPHILRFLASLITGVPEDKLRVIAPEVGGGFGSKIARVSRRDDRGLLLDEAGASGQMDGDPSRELSGDDARARSRARGGARRHQRREDPWPALHGVGGHGRVSVDRRAGHSDDSPRTDAVGPVPRARAQRGCLRRLHQHDAGRGVSRRRAARSDVHARTHARQAGATD